MVAEEDILRVVFSLQVLEFVEACLVISVDGFDTLITMSIVHVNVVLAVARSGEQIIALDFGPVVSCIGNG